MKNPMCLQVSVVLIGTTTSLLAFAPAHAVGVNFGGILYDVSVVETSYSSSSGLFQLPPNGSMPWWGSQANADFFAGEAFDTLGEGSMADYGPLFAYSFNAATSQVTGTLQDLFAPGFVIDGAPAASDSVKYAIATAPVPGPLPLFGAVAAFGCSRRLRRRISNR